MRQFHRFVLGVAGCAAIMALPARVSATPDHLVCRGAKEAAPHSAYSADVLSTTYAGTGCVVKTPAKLVCEEATVSNVTPPTTYGAYHGQGNPGRFVCYALKCPKEVETVNLPDLIDAHTFTVKGTKLLCAPEVVTEMSACSTPGDACNSCASGCAARQDGGSPANACLNPELCFTADVFCNDFNYCPAGYACVTDPHNPMMSSCCAACAP